MDIRSALNLIDEGRFDDENAYEYGTTKTAAEYASHVWYHGSEADMKNFMKATVRNPRFVGLWFAENPKATGYYGPHQYKVKLGFKNPLIVGEEEYIENKPNGPGYWARKARDEGHDAVIIQDIIDGDTESTVCCVFNPRIIKIVDRDMYVDEEVKFPLAKGSLDRARGNYGAMICVMNPKDFLRLTTVSDLDREHIINKDEFAPSVAAYKAGEHPTYNKNMYGMPYLNVDWASGKVLGHEGRHRAAMVLREGGTKFPCVLNFRSSLRFEVSYFREPISFEDGEVVYGRGQHFEQTFDSQEEAQAFIAALEKENDDIHGKFYNSEIKNHPMGGSTMKGSPRSNPDKWEYAEWKPEDMPAQLIGQFDTSVVVPTSGMKYGVVKGYNHFKR